ncbi:hypothetical protein DPMN_056176 [Dreissena polymorpha]|uniref:Uncharacterized protein n=1 Tax=Dreissena polymorpha TaxID=45954 RepID=A0A9D4HTD1_DREPO|nr:hypothetical protein DPMN_056176 [Dreissena polymorpha]
MKETREKEKITSENILEKLGLLDEDIENSIAEEIKKCEEDTEKAKRHLSSTDKIKKVMKERYSDINETGSIYDKKSTEIKDENPFQNTRRELYQDELNDNDE